jgi:PAS domain S-box-containing protein
MKDEKKTEKQLLNELVEMRQRLAELEDLDSERARIEDTLKQAEQEKRTILDSLVEHVVYHDMEMRVLWANRAACDSVGMTREELVGRHCYEIWAKRSDPCEDCPVQWARETGQPQALEKTTPDGRSWYLHGSPVRDTNGDIVGMVELTLEISERKRAEEALRYSRQLLKKTFASLLDAIFIVDADTTKIIDCNPAAAETFGYTRQEMLGRKTDILHVEEASLEQFRVHLYPAVEEKGFLVLPEFRMKRKNGEVFFTEHSVVPLEDEQGERVGWVSVVRDITGPKQAEETLRESEERYRRITESTTDYIFTVRIENGRPVETFHGPACEAVTGYTSEEFSSDPSLWIRMVPEDDWEVVREQASRLLSGHGPQTIEHRIVRKDGQIRWVGNTPVPHYDVQGNLISYDGLVRDITERKKAEEALQQAHDELERRVEERTAELLRTNEQLQQEIEERKRVEDALRESEETLKAILAASPVGICLVRDRILDWANQAMYRIWGYEENSLLRKDTEILYPNAEEYERVGREFYSDIEEKGIGQIETRLVTKDGREIHCYLQGSPLTPSDLSKGVIVAAMDITERKKTEEALKDSERRYRFLAENVTDVIWTMDMNLRLTYESPSVTQLRGYTVEEARAQTLEEILTPASLEAAKKALDEEFARRESVKEIPNRSRTLELELRRKDGSTVWTEVKASLLRNPEGKPIGILGVTRDISERKQAEEKLHIYQEQLRSLASELSFTEERQRRRLATDLHDSIGQLLAISKLKVDELRNDTCSAEFASDLYEIGQLIGQAIQQTRSLTFDLSPPVLYELGLGAALEAFVENMQILHGIHVHFTDDDQPKPLNEDTSVLLFRAVQELLINSIKHARAQNAKISTHRDGNRIRIRVEDDGIGFDVSELDSHIDKAGKFGLFSIRERLHHLGGRFEIASKPGHGTQATLVASLEGEGVTC